MLVFRDQIITSVDHKRFAGHFGSLRPVNPPPEDGDPFVLEISTSAQAPNVAGNGWHADGTADAEPSLGSMLYITDVPRGGAGGDTMFANMHLAHELCSPLIRNLLEQLTDVHDRAQAFRSYPIPAGYEPPSSEHPVVVQHPETNRKILFVNPAYTSHIPQLSRDESRALLDMLFALVPNNPMLCCRVRWHPNTLVFWDNRCVQHHAVYDYYPLTRYGRRIAINAQRPGRVPMTVKSLGGHPDSFLVCQSLPAWLSQIVELIFDRTADSFRNAWRDELRGRFAKLGNVDDLVPFRLIHDWHANSVSPLIIESCTRQGLAVEEHENLQQLHRHAWRWHSVSEKTWRTTLEPALRAVYFHSYPYQAAFVAAASAANSYARSHGYSTGQAKKYGDDYAVINTDANARLFSAANARANSTAYARAFARSNHDLLVHAYPACERAESDPRWPIREQLSRRRCCGAPLTADTASAGWSRAPDPSTQR